MPGAKRKERGPTPGSKNGIKASATALGGKRKRHDAIRTFNGHSEEEIEEEEEEASGSDDFDDGEDLMAAAANGDQDEDDESEEDVSNGEDDDGDDSDAGGDVGMYSDEDLEGGFIDVAAEDDRQDGVESTLKPSGKQKSLYAIPSRDEMSQLKNTSELFKNNIFRLKIDEMLSEVRPKYDDSAALEYVLRHLKGRFESLDSIEPAPLPQAMEQLSKAYKISVKVPFPSPAPKDDSPLKFGFERPTKVQMAGSWILKAAAMRPEGADVDVVLTMPSSLFQEKDRMNLRYFYKRAYYLAVIGAAITSDDSLGLECTFAAREDDARRSYLVLRSKRDGSQGDFSKRKVYIKIHLAHEIDLFAPARLAPSRNNVRIETESDDGQPATPCYNASILADQLFVQHLVYLNATIASCSEFGNALVLLKTWASQRALGSGASKAECTGKADKTRGRRMALGTNNVRFLLTMVLAHLLNGPDKSQAASTSAATITRLSPGFSSYQLFRGVIDYLANHDFRQQPVFMKAIDGLLSRRDKISPQDFVDHAPHILVDPTGSINLLASLPAGSMGYLQREAKATLALLNDAEQDHFDEIFLRDRSKPSFFFDEIVNVSVIGVKPSASDMADLGSRTSAAIHRVLDTLSQALTTRRTLITAFGPGVLEWTVTGRKAEYHSAIELAVNLDPAQAFRLVDHGPRPEDAKAAEAYKAFWGELSDLRRFRDGRIVESVVWNAKGAFERLKIPRRIIKYVLQRHHAILTDDVDFHTASFEGLTAPHEELWRKVFITSPQEMGFQPAQTAFDQLAKTLRGLDDLPLSLISVVPADAALRSTSVMVPGAVNIHGNPPFSASYMPTLDFVITFESSGQWPDDLQAVQAMKMAFFESMTIKITDSLPGSEARIVLDDDADENKFWDCSALEVILASGYAFRGRIHHAREETMLQRILENKTESPHAKSQARAALDRFSMRFIHGVRHHNHIAALTHRFSAFGDSVRLFKRWVNGQVLGNQVPDELLELLTASVFVEASMSSAAPSTSHLGFLQTMRRLAEWNWRELPLSVPLAAATSATPVATMDVKVKRSIEANFAQIRKLDPGMHHYAWFIATEDEPKGSCWAREMPFSGTADALQRMAKAACRLLEAGPKLAPVQVKGLFVPSLDHFDFLIRLEPAAVSRYIDGLTFDSAELDASQKRVDEARGIRSSAFRNLGVRQGPYAGLNSGLEFVRLLESLYLDSFRLFYDHLGGTVIGGIFNPSLASKARPFRVGLGFNSMPVQDDNKSKDVTLNRKAILQEISRIGTGLVREVIEQDT